MLLVCRTVSQATRQEVASLSRPLREEKKRTTRERRRTSHGADRVGRSRSARRNLLLGGDGQSRDSEQQEQTTVSSNRKTVRSRWNRFKTRWDGSARAPAELKNFAGPHENLSRTRRSTQQFANRPTTRQREAGCFAGQETTMECRAFTVELVSCAGPRFVVPVSAASS
jgi:hypothetical protein